MSARFIARIDTEMSELKYQGPWDEIGPQPVNTRTCPVCGGGPENDCACSCDVDTETKEADTIKNTEALLDAFERETDIWAPGRSKPAEMGEPDAYEWQYLAFAYWRKVRSHTELLDEAQRKVREFQSHYVSGSPGWHDMEEIVSLLERARTPEEGR